jgi:lipopolysaccharide transport system ATP-binding protein
MENGNEILVEVKGLSKKFSRGLKRGMWYGLKDIANSMLGFKGKRKELRKEEFWAIKDINFQLRRGECLGLIGRNGAGKSTLLKMLNGLIRPDEGSITMRGKVGALIELGAGFNPILTGRENIYINGQILGFSKKEIDDKMNAILNFAEIGEFIDSPIQNYSSGMKVRLGFAIAAQMEPDVLIIDEVLAVGDLGFILKCFNTIDSLLRNTAVLFVSHAMPQVSRICTSVMVLENGRTIYLDSDVPKGIDIYYSRFPGKDKQDNQVVFNRNDDAELVEFYFGDGHLPSRDGVFKIDHLDDLKFHMKIKIREQFASPFVTISFFDKEQRPIGICQNENGISEENIIAKENGNLIYKVDLIIPRMNLSNGTYSVAFVINEGFRTKPMLRLQGIGKFQVRSKHDIWHPVEFEGKWS